MSKDVYIFLINIPYSLERLYYKDEYISNNYIKKDLTRQIFYENIPY